MMANTVTQKSDSNGFTLCKGQSAYRKKSTGDDNLVTCRRCIKKSSSRYGMAMTAVAKVFSALLPKKEGDL